MAKINDGGPAFPLNAEYDASASGIMRQVAPGEQGLSKRELFAAMAMQGMITNPVAMIANPDETYFEVRAKHSVFYADALIAELAKE